MLDYCDKLILYLVRFNNNQTGAVSLESLRKEVGKDMREFLLTSNQFWVFCASGIFLLTVGFCTSRFFTRMDSPRRSIIMIVSFFLFSECCHMNGRILGVKQGQQVGYDQGYARAKYDFQKGETIKQFSMLQEEASTTPRQQI